MKLSAQKNYGSIGHLPGSRLGEGDHKIMDGQAAILTDKPRDWKDLIIVQEKLDGANVGVMRNENGRLIGLTRKGHRAIDSPMEQFQMFQRWICRNEPRFSFLKEGERVVGEWIAMAHGTKYKTDMPFIAFDIFNAENERISFIEFNKKIGYLLPVAHLLHIGQPISIKKIEKLLDKRTGDIYGYHGALEPVEGAVWRCEREGKVDFLGKYVRQFKEDGKYFTENHNDLIWNWKLENEVVGAT